MHDEDNNNIRKQKWPLEQYSSSLSQANKTEVTRFDKVLDYNMLNWVRVKYDVRTQD
jgi:hypothetical protein